LLVAMLLPVCGPLALARADHPEAIHCMRQPVQSAEPTMQCHHGMAQTPAREGSEKSFRALNGCCQNHDCCRSLKTSEWARPASNLLSYVGLLIERALVPQFAARVSADLAGQDSTRAPPRS
jgi:hypothetical protein